MCIYVSHYFFIQAGLVEEEEGMSIIKLPHFTIPLIVRKSDGKIIVYDYLLIIFCMCIQYSITTYKPVFITSKRPIYPCSLLHNDL